MPQRKPEFEYSPRDKQEALAIAAGRLQKRATKRHLVALRDWAATLLRQSLIDGRLKV